MTRSRHRHAWLRVPNQHICAVIAIILILRPFAFSTALLVLVSGNVIVFGADGKEVNARTADMSATATGVTHKVMILHDRFLISSSGIGYLDQKSRTIYTFESMMKSIPITNKSSTHDVAEMIRSSCWPIFSDWWRNLSKTRKRPLQPFNLTGDPSLPIASYFVGGSEFLGPEVYVVELYADWQKQKLSQPILTQMYPPKTGTTRQHNLFAYFQGRKGGGMSQLTTNDSPLQKAYLRLYSKEVGALIFDKTSDLDSLVNLGKIMLTAEIEITPKSFEFPIRLCSLNSGRRATCSDSDH